mmetsp:Transcript_39283/g.111219  ORF Transcript_39283/g.111219 Transcript_39283/m.111219 type:complete len:236 (-) Transcript_39283:77-784(-)
MQSAGTAAPEANKTMSPGTKIPASTFSQVPSRMTVALGFKEFFRAATASPALVSSYHDSVALPNCRTSRMMTLTQSLMTASTEIGGGDGKKQGSWGSAVQNRSNLSAWDRRSKYVWTFRRRQRENSLMIATQIMMGMGNHSWRQNMSHLGVRFSSSSFRPHSWRSFSHSEEASPVVLISNLLPSSRRTVCFPASSSSAMATSSAGWRTAYNPEAARFIVAACCKSFVLRVAQCPS